MGLLFEGEFFHLAVQLFTYRVKPRGNALVWRPWSTAQQSVGPHSECCPFTVERENQWALSAVFSKQHASLHSPQPLCTAHVRGIIWMEVSLLSHLVIHSSRPPAWAGRAAPVLSQLKRAAAACGLPDNRQPQRPSPFPRNMCSGWVKKGKNPTGQTRKLVS